MKAFRSCMSSYKYLCDNNYIMDETTLKEVTTKSEATTSTNSEDDSKKINALWNSRDVIRSVFVKSAAQFSSLLKFNRTYELFSTTSLSSESPTTVHNKDTRSPSSRHQNLNSKISRRSFKPKNQLRCSSINDVRKILAVVSMNYNDSSCHDSTSDDILKTKEWNSLDEEISYQANDVNDILTSRNNALDSRPNQIYIKHLLGRDDTLSKDSEEIRAKRKENAEIALHLAEGTIRALRDLALDEALQLHYSLGFWSNLYERPILSRLQFTPWVWPEGYNHEVMVGNKVSQLQAVLARRCAAIGILQQHLLRAGWQRGVAQWGILGQGSEWTNVTGVSDMESSNKNFNDDVERGTDIDANDTVDDDLDWIGSKMVGNDSSDSRSNNHHYIGNSSNRLKHHLKQRYYGNTHLCVSYSRGGKIVTNESALAAWSIDAISVVRNQLYRAGDGTMALPYFENWPLEFYHFHSTGAFKHDSDVDEKSNESIQLEGSDLTSNMTYKKLRLSLEGNGVQEGVNLNLPIWATKDANIIDSKKSNFDLSSPSVDRFETNKKSCVSERICASVSPNKREKIGKTDNSNEDGGIVIDDLNMMASEISQLLTSMENIMNKQRFRRLEKLKPPSRLMRSWYVTAVALPCLTYFGYRLAKDNAGFLLAIEVYRKVSSFCAEHVSEPLQSIYRELFTKSGREDVTDRKARLDGITILRKMIKGWLDDTFPDMPEIEREKKSSMMDISLIEERKEESIKNFLEINSIVRMSMIEMQFIKKELMNALYSIDELMGSNEINMKMAAMTPAFLLISGIHHLCKFLFYALLKLGKSKEETYSSFRRVVLSIERLLVIRDNPPSISPLPSDSYNMFHSDPNNSLSSNENISKKLFLSDQEQNYQEQNYQKKSVLDSDDLGMLMLLVHQCRSILRQDSKRFSRHELCNMSEDLAELAGERGVVSVSQQLKIVARMCRTYSFLKVVSSGIPL